MGIETYIDVTKRIGILRASKKGVMLPVNIPVRKGKELEIKLREKGKTETVIGKISGIYAIAKKDDAIFIKNSKDVYTRLAGMILYSEEPTSFVILNAESIKYTGK